MSNKPYRNRSNIQAAVWLIGIGILWWTNLWWPGILIVAGISMLAQVLVGGAAGQPDVIPTAQSPAETPKAEKTEENPAAEKEETWSDEEAETPAFLQKEKLQGDISLLPEKCPACGGPIAQNAHKVVWMGERTARCPFCDTVINL